jgi:uncharacterized membrane protein YfcA
MKMAAAPNWKELCGFAAKKKKKTLKLRLIYSVLTRYSSRCDNTLNAMGNSSILALLLVLLSPYLVSSAEDSCAKANLFKCPSDICNSTILVKDCLDCDGFLNTDTKTETCFDRKLLSEDGNPHSGYLWRDIVGICFWFFAAGVATACGVGGGGIYVPLGILLLQFAPKPSSGLSQASIFGASLGGLALNIRNRHPFTTKSEKSGNEDSATKLESLEMDAPENTDTITYYSRPLIDYDMALFLAPMEMAGAVLGVLIQKILPNWLYLTLAAIILGFTAYKTFKKFLDARKKEKAKRDAAEAAEAAAVGEEVADTDTAVESSKDPLALNETTPLEVSSSGDGSKKEGEEEIAGDDYMDAEEAKARCQELLQLDARQYPREKLFALIILWIGLILLTFFKGGKGVDSIIGISCKSPWYGALIGVQFLWTLGFAFIFGVKLIKNHDEKKNVRYPFHPNDVHWDFAKTRFYAFFTFLAGIVAGLIGIGGGMVLGPLMLIMGIHPRVSSATTATMIVLTSSGVAIMFVTAGLVPWEYAVTFFCTCFTGAYIGKTKIDGYVKRTGKASILILLLATIIVLATIGCVVIVLTRLAAGGWCLAGFNKFCNLKEEDQDEDICIVNEILRL